MEIKFEMNQTKIKGGCQSGRKVVIHDFKSDLPLGKEDGDRRISLLSGFTLYSFRKF